MQSNSSDHTSLKKESRLLFRHGFIYGIGNVFNKMIAFLLIPVYTRFLTPADYGTLELIGITTEIFGMLISARISRAMYRFYFEYDLTSDKNEVVSTAIIAFCGIGFLGILLPMFFSPNISNILLDTPKHYIYFIISFSTLWFNTIVLMAFDYLQIRKRSMHFIVMSFLKLLAALTFNILFIVFFKMGVLGILFGNLISSILITFILAIPVLHEVGLNFSKRKFFELINFALPLIPGAIANFVVLVSDRYFLKIFGSLADTGIYSLSYKFGRLPHIFITSPFFQVWGVRRFELFKQQDTEETLGRIVTYFIVLLTFVGLLISALVKDTIVIIADQAYWDAYKYVPILILSYIIFGFYNNFSVNILISKQTKLISYIDLSNGAINILLNLWLIRKWGIYGASFSTLISYTLRIIALYIVSRRIGKIYFEFYRVFKIFVSAFFLYGACYWIESGNPYINLFCKTIVVSTFPFSLIVLKFFNASEIIFIKKFVFHGNGINYIRKLISNNK